jgi:hypothetical protein
MSESVSQRREGVYLSLEFSENVKDSARARSFAEEHHLQVFVVPVQACDLLFGCG